MGRYIAILIFLIGFEGKVILGSWIYALNKYGHGYAG